MNRGGLENIDKLKSQYIQVPQFIIVKLLQIFAPSFDGMNIRMGCSCFRPSDMDSRICSEDISLICDLPFCKGRLRDIAKGYLIRNGKLCNTLELFNDEKGIVSFQIEKGELRSYFYNPKLEVSNYCKSLSSSESVLIGFSGGFYNPSQGLCSFNFVVLENSKPKSYRFDGDIAGFLCRFKNFNHKLCFKVKDDK